MGLKVNFSGAGKALPPDTYELVLDSHQETKSRAGDDMVKLVFRVADGDYAGKKLSRNFMAIGDGSYYLMDALKACGADPEELSPEGQEEDDEGVDLTPLIKACYGAHVLAKTGIRYDPKDPKKEYTDLQSIKSLDSEDEDE